MVVVWSLTQTNEREDSQELCRKEATETIDLATVLATRRERREEVRRRRGKAGEVVEVEGGEASEGGEAKRWMETAQPALGTSGARTRALAS